MSDDDTPLVLVHGVPETERVWGPLVTELGRRDVTRLSPVEDPAHGAQALNDFWASLPAFDRAGCM
jgi:pimeloyl-ACP methyl ester carboxylesterase